MTAGSGCKASPVDWGLSKAYSLGEAMTAYVQMRGTSCTQSRVCLLDPLVGVRSKSEDTHLLLCVHTLK